jgi:hypothetical protein
LCVTRKEMMEMKFKKRGKFFLNIGNLQTFSDDGSADDKGADDKGDDGQGDDKKDGGVTLSPEVEAHFKKLLQQEGDRIRTKAAKEKEALKQQLEDLKKDKMTDAEKKDYELQQQREELERDRAELNRLKLEGATVDILKEVELDLDFKPFVLASDEDSTKVRAKTLKELFDKAVKAEVDKLYGENGRQIERSNGGFTNVTGNLKELALKNNIRTT